MNVAKFLDRSTLHSTRLQDAFKAVATVKVSSDQRRADRKFMEYHFKALPVNTTTNVFCYVNFPFSFRGQ